MQVKIAALLSLNGSEGVFLHIGDLILAESGLVLELSVVDVHGYIDDKRIGLCVHTVLNFLLVTQYLIIMDDLKISQLYVLLTRYSSLLVVQVEDLCLEFANGAAEEPCSVLFELIIGHTLLP